MPHDHSDPWKLTKGLIISNIVLTSALIKSRVIAADDVLNELDMIINTFTKDRPDAVEIIETLKTTRDGIAKLNKPDDDTLWYSDIIGNA
jgi:hypothetical protein